jgi:hypothetical protein
VHSFQVCITSTSILASLRCTCFVIARQILSTPCRHSGQTPHRPSRTLRPTDRNTGKRNQCPTALEALALKVPSEGPKVDVVALAPWEVPNWVEHVSYMGVENPCVRKTWIRNLTSAVKDSNTMLVHLAAATLNRETDGLGVVGGAAATYSRGGAEITSHDWVIGTDLTQFDADAYLLARAAEVMAQCYTVEVAPPDHTYFFCASSPALQAVQNPRSIKAHSFVLRFHCALTTLFTLHNGRITLCWAPKDDSFVLLIRNTGKNQGRRDR